MILTRVSRRGYVLRQEQTAHGQSKENCQTNSGSHFPLLRTAELSAQAKNISSEMILRHKYIPTLEHISSNPHDLVLQIEIRSIKVLPNLVSQDRPFT